MTEIVAGASWYELKSFDDRRGRLLAFEDGHNLPFSLRRFFLISADDPSITRGEHSSLVEELLVAVCGSVVCDLDNGDATASVTLSPATQALWLRPGMWIRLRQFAPGTVLVVAVSLRYADTIQSPRPNREAIAEALRSQPQRSR